MIKPLAATVLAAAVLLAGIPAAQARPVDPSGDYISRTDVGPDQRDWWCTWQASVNDVSCVYSPGAHRPMGFQYSHAWKPLR